jgi:hypothetical protein
MGNNEAEFMADPRATKGRDFSAQLAAHGLSPAATSACQGEIGTLLCGLPFAARVNDWFFSHAGNTAGRSINQIAVDLRKSASRQTTKTDRLPHGAELQPKWPAGFQQSSTCPQFISGGELQLQGHVGVH